VVEFFLLGRRQRRRCPPGSHIWFCFFPTTTTPPITHTLHTTVTHWIFGRFDFSDNRPHAHTHHQSHTHRHTRNQSELTTSCSWPPQTERRRCDVLSNVRLL
jgi:hypothetical protein